MKFGDVNVGALAAGVGTLFVTIGGATATGVLGRIERNEPSLLVAAVIAVLLGSALFVLAGLPLTAGPSELFALLIGTGLTVVGLGWGMTAAVRVGSERERPAIEASITTDGARLNGKVTAANLASNTRTVLLVHGLAGRDTVGGDQAYSKEDLLAHYYVGPDDDGKVALPIDLHIPEGYEAIGILARTEDSDIRTCADYLIDGRERATTEPEDVGAACVVLGLPEQPESVTETPRVALTWIGRASTANRVRATVSTGGAPRRVAIRVATAPGGARQQLYRALSGTDGNGRYRAVIHVPVSRGICRVCVHAQLGEAATKSFPGRDLKCPMKKDGLPLGEAAAELRRAST
jgi:hypothetical protein